MKILTILIVSFTILTILAIHITLENSAKMHPTRLNFFGKICRAYSYCLLFISLGIAIIIFSDFIILLHS